MPSEQAAGRPVYSSDLYSLGLTAIYLLTGKEPLMVVTVVALILLVYKNILIIKVGAILYTHQKHSRLNCSQI